MNHNYNNILENKIINRLIIIATLVAVVITVSGYVGNKQTYTDEIACQPLDGSAPVKCVDVVDPKEPGVAKGYCRTTVGEVIGCDLWIVQKAVKK